MRHHIIAMTAAAALFSALANAATADPYLGELRVFASANCPQGWLPADGRPLRVVENPLLFELIQTTYGGDGVNEFLLPDLRQRTPVGAATPGGEGGTITAEYGQQQRFLFMNWCIAVQGALPAGVRHAQPRAPQTAIGHSAR